MDLEPGKLLAAAALLSCLSDLAVAMLQEEHAEKNEERHRRGLGRGDERVSSNAACRASGAFTAGAADGARQLEDR